jgi:tetratricopeptide (TPR) repeat protein
MTAATIIFIVLIVFGIVGAVELFQRAAKPNPTSNEYMQHARSKREFSDENGELEALNNAVETQLRDHPESPNLEAHWRRGQLYSKRRQYEVAIADYTTLIERTPDFFGNYTARGNAYYFLGQLEPALADFDEAIRLEPRYARNYQFRGSIHLKNKTWDKAIENFSRAIELAKSNAPDAALMRSSLPMLYANRALARSRSGDSTGADADYEDSILLNPKSAMTYNNRGWMHANHGAFDKAIIDCNQAMNLDPRLVNAFGSRGFTYFQMGDYARALQDFDQVVRIKPDHKFAIAGQAITHYALSEVEQAKSLWQQVIDMDAKYHDAQALTDEYFCGGAFIETARKLVDSLTP